MSASSEARRARPWVAACAVAVTPVAVPPGLGARTALELSGVAWAPALGRYLVVSDDIDAEAGGKKHAARVFALKPSAEIEEAPLPVEGLDELNDPESICAGPDGTFFLVTSHSANKKGNLPPSRRKLLHLALAGRSLRVLGQLDLTEARGPGGRGLLGTAGLPENRPLDIEAVAYRDGGLYVGLKSPLTDAGEASIVRLDDPVAAFKAGRIAPASLGLWSRARLCLPRDGREVCEGVADMTFLADGSMLLVGNAPKNAPPDGGGALWRLPGPNRPAALLHHFEGLKPEGITVAPGGSSAVIVFDRDRQQPAWALWPLAKP
jgi:hypothetical protein